MKLSLLLVSGARILPLPATTDV